jgi:drug/metabolite transporter (DMT)-like permease
MAVAVIQMLAGGCVIATLALLTGARPTVEMFSLRSSLALLYLAVFGSVIGYTAYLYALTKLSAGKVSSYAYVNPAVAVFFGALLLAEPVTLRMIVSMVIILTGVAVIQLDRRRVELKRA